MSEPGTQIYSNGMPALEDYIRRKRITNRSLRTISEYSRIVVRFFEWVGHKKPEEITERDIERYLEHMQDKELSRNSQAKYIEALSSFFNFLHKRPEYNVKINPAADLSSEIKHERKPRPSTATWENVRKAILSMTDPRDQAIAVIAAKTGMRISEILNLEIQDVDLQNGFALIRKGKGGKSRSIPIDDEIIKVLKRWLIIRPKDIKDNHIFTSIRGTHLNRDTARKRLNAVAITNGLSNGKDFTQKFTPHTYRSVFTTEMRNARCREDILRRIRGDALSAVADIYTIVTPEQIKTEYERCVPKLGL
ncbi:site-specific recombinase XerD [Candidatus Methanoperedens nitroreducens]|uniref:Site-specific recombinase XerD n=1 Tax=Candidatus Methanoperedens nitratireducens TaxID=1392998 RepID=A0A062VAH5_9EURY|nr:tyrosine-type recombinase/integrase [Candidatus Methanoperedens nitroreducens]KCZ73483.1 site-specific recombinase XerD [Candidatus Methanoperedens nitroreducens]